MTTNCLPPREQRYKTCHWMLILIFIQSFKSVSPITLIQWLTVGFSNDTPPWWFVVLFHDNLATVEVLVHDVDAECPLIVLVGYAVSNGITSSTLYFRGKVVSGVITGCVIVDVVPDSMDNGNCHDGQEKSYQQEWFHVVVDLQLTSHWRNRVYVHVLLSAMKESRHSWLAFPAEV